MSARHAVAPTGREFSFLPPDAALPPAESGMFHVPGAMQAAVTQPTLVVEFTTLSPDFALDVPATDPDPPPAASVVPGLGAASDAGTVVIEFTRFDANSGIGGAA